LASDLPSGFLSSLQTALGFDEKEFAEAHAATAQVVSVRKNPFKPAESVFLQNLISEKVPWSSLGYYLKERPLFTIDPSFHAGAYYVQEASSMFLEEAMKQSCDLAKQLTVLDLCAAPGGKSTLIQSIISADSLLVSNEVIKPRATILAENITKWGAANVVVTNNDPKDFKKLPEFFHCIVVDAPCSGSGMFRKDPVAISEWSLNNVALCCQRQQRILADIETSLKPGGILIYSTCSYSIEEDEEIADWLTDNYSFDSIRLKVKDEWGIVETRSTSHGAYGYRFYPGKIKGEGFFIAVFKKASHDEGTAIEFKNRKAALKAEQPSKAMQQVVSSFLTDAENFSFISWQQDILAIRSSHLEQVLSIQKQLYIKKAGINMGTIIRDELIAAHELVISNCYNHVLDEVAVDEGTALDYLRRKDISLDTIISGWAVLTYEGLALGLVKILPNRINNYYPKEWRILNK
jgi:16S rRNA C967 or C1407 C5-methylase (RsmB/RsmF family)/NOL1/NOP2/fmu family ribosome biogenesis protein